MLKTLNIVFFLIALFLINTNLCLAQVDSISGEIIGVVKDQQSNLLVGARVSARQIETNQIRSIEVDEKAGFRFLKLPPGIYELTASASNFNSQTEKLVINIGRTFLLEFILSVAGSSEVIEVVTDNNINQTENSTTIDQQRIENLPINRRNFLDFALTIPRLTSDFELARSTTVSSGFSANGQSGRFNNVTVDGLDNNDRYLGAVRATFSQEAVEEFQVVSDSYSAEFGRALGGIVNIVTRGGNNQFHSNLFFISRNEKVAAKAGFSRFSPVSSQIQFGSFFSGPIKKDKAFFFLSFERFLSKSFIPVDVKENVVEAFRRRNFSVRTGLLSIPDTTISLLGRLDWQTSPSNNTWIRYNFGGVYQGKAETFGGVEFENVGGARRLNDSVVAFNNTYFSSENNFVHETRFLFSNRDQKVPAQDSLPDTIVVENGTLGRAGTFFRLPQVLKEQVYQVVDKLTLSRGRNQIKLGVDFQYFRVPPKSVEVPFFNSGFIRYTPLDLSALSGIPNLPTLSALQAFDPSLRTNRQRAALDFFSAILPTVFPDFPRGLKLADTPLPFFYVQNFNDPRTDTTGKLFSLFLQNDLKARSNLLIKLGLRYDLNRIGVIPKNNGNFSPRIAFSYQPKVLQNLKLRAAYGFFFGVTLVSPGYDVNLSNNSKALVLAFPFTAIPSSFPNGRFPLSSQPPANVRFTPQLGANFQFDNNFKNSYSQQATLALDYSLDKFTSISLAYVFVRGAKLFGLRNINPVIRPITGDPLGSMINGRVFPDKGMMIEFSSSYNSYYHAFTSLFERRFKGVFGLLASYTFSKALDNTNSIEPFSEQQAADPLNPRLEKSFSAQDQRHRVVISSVYQLPNLKNFFLRDYQFSTIFTANSGRPYNLLVGEDLNMNGDIINPTDRPAGIARNAGIQPSFIGLDLRLMRKIKIKDKIQLLAFIESFNVINKFNVFGPASTSGFFRPDENGSFNLPQQKGGRFLLPREIPRDGFSPRQIQFGIKLEY